jgi:hypothetical protein
MNNAIKIWCDRITARTGRAWKLRRIHEVTFEGERWEKPGNLSDDNKRPLQARSSKQ